MRMQQNYREVLKIEYFYDVYSQIRKATKHKEKIFKYELFLSSNLTNLLLKLKNNNYFHGKYNVFLIKDPKYRIIMSENLDDKIVNHFISKYILQYNISYRLLPCNVATRVGMGTKEAYRLFKNYINNMKFNSDVLYVLKCDIHKYFYSINHKILFSKLKKIINDNDALFILKQIIDSTDSMYVNENINNVIRNEKSIILSRNISDKEKEILFTKLDEIPTYRKGYGLPIGNITSQILAIFYLNDFDHFVKEKLQIKGYVRYMDDFILIHPNKTYLKECLLKIKKYLESIDLKLNSKTNIYNMKNGVIFLGYRFLLKNNRLITRIRTDTKKRIKKKYKHLSKNDYSKFERVKASYNGYLKVASANQIRYLLNKHYT